LLTVDFPLNSFDLADVHQLALPEVIKDSTAYSLHLVDEPGEWNYPLHYHAGFNDLLVLERGILHQEVNGIHLTMHPGAMIFIRASDQHALHGSHVRFYNLNLPQTEWQRLAVYAEGKWWQELTAPGPPPQARLAVPERDRLHQDLVELFAAQSGAMARVALARFLLRWLPTLQTRPAPAVAEPGWLAPLVERIAGQIPLQWTAADLPRLAGVSAAHVSRTFRRHLRCTPSQYLNRLRLRQAAQLLATTECDILELALRVGFQSASYFYRLFVAEMGVPPAVYRRRHRMPVSLG